MLKKPEELTPEGFSKLLYTEVLAFKGDPRGTQRGAAAAARVSPDALNDMVACRFPSKPPDDATEAHRRKITRGAVGSLVRVCDAFKFDLDACLQALELPKDEFEIENARAYPLLRRLDAEDLKILMKQVELTGPITVKLSLQLLDEMRWRREIVTNEPQDK